MTLLLERVNYVVLLFILGFKKKALALKAGAMNLVVCVYLASLGTSLSKRTEKISKLAMPRSMPKGTPMSMP